MALSFKESTTGKLARRGSSTLMRANVADNHSFLALCRIAQASPTIFASSLSSIYNAKMGHSSYVSGKFNGYLIGQSIDTIKVSDIYGWTLCFFFKPLTVYTGYNYCFMDIANKLCLYTNSSGVLNATAVRSSGWVATTTGTAITLSTGTVYGAAISYSNSSSTMYIRIFLFNDDGSIKALSCINVTGVTSVDEIHIGGVSFSESGIPGYGSKMYFQYISLYAGIHFNDNVDPTSIAALFWTTPMLFSYSDKNSVRIYNLNAVYGQTSITYDIKNDFLSGTLDQDQCIYISYNTYCTVKINDTTLTASRHFVPSTLYSLTCTGNYNTVYAGNSSYVDMMLMYTTTCYPSPKNLIIKTAAECPEKIKYIDGDTTHSSDSDIDYVYCEGSKVWAAPGTLTFTTDSADVDFYIKRTKYWDGTTDSSFPAIYGYYYSSSYLTSGVFTTRLGETWEIKRGDTTQTVKITGRTANSYTLVGTDGSKLSWTCITSASKCTTIQTKCTSTASKCTSLATQNSGSISCINDAAKCNSELTKNGSFVEKD